MADILVQDYVSIDPATVKISTADFKNLTVELIETMVENETSPFNLMLEKYTDTIDSGDGGSLDSLQRASAISSFMRETYSDVNKQAMSTALDIMKTNASLALQVYKAETDYNNSRAEIALTQEKVAIEVQNLLISQKNLAIKSKELLIADKKISELEYQILEQRAKIKKQWGVTEASSFTFNDGYDYAPVMDGDGLTKWYRVNASAEFIDSNDVVTAIPSEFVMGVVDQGNSTFGTFISDSLNDSAIDKQIIGYDKVNLKDALKSLDERAALMQNAKVPPVAEELMLRVDLENAILDGTGVKAEYWRTALPTGTEKLTPVKDWEGEDVTAENYRFTIDTIDTPVTP
jgi:hypothetical protein